MKEYITSDWQFGHENICGKNSFVTRRRHFASVAEMDQSIIEAINSVVTDEDKLYHLGDISLYNKPKETFEQLIKINGQLILYKGNHDHTKLLNYIKNKTYVLPNGQPKFIIYDVGSIIKRNGMVFYLTHYPMGLGEGRKGMRSLCGHIHEEKAYDANVLNIGIDSPELPTNHLFGVPLELEVAMTCVNQKWERWYKSIMRLIN